MSDAAGSARVPPEELLAHAAWARELAAHLVRDAATADDVVQDALIAGIERPPLADRPVRPWLAAVIRKLALARRRGDGRRAKREDVVGAAAATRPTPSAAEVAARLDAHRVLTAIVADLPEPLRATVYMRYYEGLDSTEIAQRHGVAAETVRWRLAKALAELRARLDGRSPGGRAEWLAAFAPIALTRHEPPPTTSSSLPAPGAAVLTGVLAMTLTTKILLGGAAVAALFALLWSTDVMKFGGGPAAPATPPDVELASTSPSRTEKRVAPTKPARRRGVEESAAPKPDEPKPAADAGAAPVPARGLLEVRARVLDSAGAAAAGARVEFGAMGSSIGGDGDADGRVTFSMDPAVAAPTGLDFVVSAVRCATRLVSSPLPREGALDLGDVRLGAGGVVAGRVVDASGKGIAGASVAVATTSKDGTILVDVAPLAWTDADGRFVLRGVPVGKPALSAGADGFDEKGASVDVRIGEESHGVVIALTRVDPSTRVRGVVLTPDGAPAPRATVTYRAEGHGSTSQGTLSADGAGRFDIEGGKDKAWRLSARDENGLWSASATADVRSGAEDVVLRLTTTRWAEVCVTRSDGRPAERFEVMLQALDGLVLDRMGEEARAGGVVKIKLPAQPFAFVATAPGCAVATAGPIDPSKVAGRIEVRAQVLPGLRGRVTAGGAPVAKARVTLRSVVAPGMREIRNGFACLTSSVMPDNGVETEADGSFELTLREAGKFVLRAEAPDLAASEAGPFELTPEIGRAGIAIALTKGGAIEGRVLAAPGKTVDGVIVGASRGDGEARTVRAGHDGAFRFERLTPGSWIVKQTDREIRPGTNTVMTTMGEARFDWNCKVDDGATTHFDVDLRVEPGTAVRGELRVDGAPGAGWRVSMLAGMSIFTSEETAAGSVAESGAFRFVAPRPGDYLACVRSPKGLHVYAPVKVGAAETSVVLDFKTGQAKVRGATPGEPLALVWDDAGGRLALAEAGVGADGTGGPTQMPAGRVRLVRAVPDQPDVRKWPTLAEGELDAGGTVLLEVAAK